MKRKATLPSSENRERDAVDLPPRIRISERRYGYRAVDLQRWLDSRTETSPPTARQMLDDAHAAANAAMIARARR
jgi:hypothetical protein